MTNQFLSNALELRNEIRKDTWSICFCENGLNETLWLKYANQYKGFVLIYSPDPQTIPSSLPLKSDPHEEPSKTMLFFYSNPHERPSNR